MYSQYSRTLAPVPATTPPITPEIVLLGLMDGHSLGPRSTLPTAKAKVSAAGEMTWMSSSARVEPTGSSLVKSMVASMAVGYTAANMDAPVPANVVLRWSKTSRQSRTIASRKESTSRPR